MTYLQRPRRRHAQTVAIAAAIVVLALFLRSYQLGTQELWADEAVTFHVTVLESDLGDVLSTQNTPPLYYLLLRWWTRLAGYTEAALRAPSVLFGTLLVGVVMWLGSMVFNPRIGLWSGLFAAINPIHIYYSQEARAYALLVFLVILSYAVLWRALQTNNWRAWAGFAVCLVLALYTHYLAILSLAPTAVLVLVWQGPGKISLCRNYALAVLSAAALFAPWTVLRFSAPSTTGLEWMKLAWEHAGLLAIPRSLELLGLGSQQGFTYIHLKQYSGIVFPWGLRWLGVSVLLLLAVSFLVPWGDRSLGIPWVEKRKLWLGTCLLFPLIALWSVSFLKPTYVVGRYDMTGFSVYPIILGFGMAKIAVIKRTGRFLAAALAMIFLTVVAAKLFAYYHTARPLADARRLAETLDSSVANGDVVVFTGLKGMPVIYYLFRRGYRWQGDTCENPVRGRRFGCRMFPTGREADVGAYDVRHITMDDVRRDTKRFVEQLEAAENRLWVLLYSINLAANQSILPPLESRMALELQRAGYEGTLVKREIIVFEKKSF